MSVEFDVHPPLSNKTLFHKVDLLGKKTNKKGFQLHIYDDGSVEKKYVMRKD